jgi:hypothetical protein
MAAEKKSGGAQILGDDVAKTVVETVGKKMRTKMRTLCCGLTDITHHRYSN